MKNTFLLFGLVFISLSLLAQNQKVGDESLKIKYLGSNHDKLLENQDPQIIILDDRLVKVSTESKLKGQTVYHLPT